MNISKYHSSPTLLFILLIQLLYVFGCSTNKLIEPLITTLEIRDYKNFKSVSEMISFSKEISKMDNSSFRRDDFKSFG